MSKTSRQRCMERCRTIADAYERVTCCAHCRAVHAALERRAEARERKPVGPAPLMRGGRAAMFGPGPRSEKRRVRGLAGVAALGDAAEDRRNARSTAAAIAAAATLACQAIVNQGERQRCMNSANAALAAANTVIDEATRETNPSSTSADEALEELRRELEAVQSQAELQRQAELAREREARQAASARAAAQAQQQSDSQTALWVGGGIAAVAALGVGYFVLTDRDG